MILFYLKEIIIVASIATTIINVTIINNEEEVTTTILIIITRITIIIVIKTEIQGNEEDQTIGIAVVGTTTIVVEVVDPEHLIARKEQTLALAHRHSNNSLNRSNSNNKIFEMNQLIIVGRNRHNSNNKKIVSENQIAVDLVESGINAAVKLITLFRFHVMNVLNRSCLVPLIQVSILANTKTFPWRRRDSKFLNTSHHLMTSS